MEKTLYNQVGEVKGASSETEDSFSFQFTPQNDNLKRTRGSLFTLVTVSGKSDNRYEKAKSIYHQFQSSYYAKASGNILDGLSDTIEQLIKTTLKKEEETGVKISVITAVFWGTVVYLSKHGEGAVFVARGDKVKKLDFAKVASGVLEDQDTVCLASAEFVSNISVEELSTVLTQEKFEDTLKALDKKMENVKGSVCDVIRLSVNAPEQMKVENLAIAEVASEGVVEEIPATQVVDEVNPIEEEVLDEEPTQEDIEAAPELAVPKEISDDPFEQQPIKKENLVVKHLPKVKDFGRAVFLKISKPWRKPGPGELHDPVAIRRARIAQVVIVIVIFLVLSISIGVVSKGTEEKENEINQVITSIESDLQEAANIKSIDPQRALALVDQVQEDLESAKDLDRNNDKIKNLEKQSRDLEAEITKTTIIKSVKILTDFDKLKKGAEVAEIALLGNNLLSLDKTQGALFSYDISGNSATDITSSVSASQTVASYPAGFYISGQAGIFKLDQSLKSSNIGTNANWGKIISSATYQNNLYLLDIEKAEIWRYLATSSGLGGAKTYISGEKPDLSNAVAIAIDNLVWVANKNGTVYKLASGKKQEDFTIIGLADPIGELSDMYTSTATTHHYFLDKGKGRIIVAEKTGNYIASYSHEQLHKAASLIVDETAKTVYFSAESKLYQFDLP